MSEIRVEDSAAVLEQDPDAEESTTADNAELEALQADTCVVICEYLPKIYTLDLMLLGAVVFAFVYKLIDNKFFRHFV